ncbi:hypothetical protein PR202_gb24582 [Eleusine coracana subsp. coracana]|uniref:Uncharacterized protein n=1 Tax=Eleusine coracana subsp. coracana TaxID=191504 RepID=A0AAV5FLF7_ELECO|nr:hypothetical protein PR202_gb24582 [Eleusine coracana subsp. coracana]
MGYPVLQQPGIAAPGQGHVSSMACGPPSNHIVNGIPAPGGYHPICMNSGNGMMENETHETTHAATACSAMSSEMAVSPSSAMSSNHVSFTPSEISGMCVDESAANATFGADVGNGGPLQIGPDGTDGSSLGQQIWGFSLSDLTADLTNLGDLSALENYTGNPFLPSDSDLMLDSPDHDDIETTIQFASAPTSSCVAIVVFSWPSPWTTPSSTHGRSGCCHVRSHIPFFLELNPPNYSAWRELFLTLGKFQVISHVDGTAPPVVDPAWSAVDFSMCSLLYSAVSLEIMSMVITKDASVVVQD